MVMSSHSRIALVCLLALAVAVPAPVAWAEEVRRSFADIDLEQIMADPDWIGPAVEDPYWMLDGGRVLFRLKREGSPVRDLHEYALDDGRVRPVLDPALETLDGADPVFDSGRRRAGFVRNGDVFVRELDTGRLSQLTRGAGNAQSLMFVSDDGGLAWRVGNDWFGWRFDAPVVAPLAVLKAEKDPDAKPEADPARDHELRLIATLAREKAQREAQREFDDAVRAADASRAPRPVYLGDKVEIVSSALSPDGRWLLAVTQPKNGDRGRAGKMPKYVTETGFEEFEDVRTRVGRNPPPAHTLHRIDLSDGSIAELKFDPLPGIAEDPLADLRKAAGKDALNGQRPVEVAGMRFSRDGARAAVMLRAIDNKDRWIATLDAGQSALSPAHRLTDPAWINWRYNDFDWLPDNQTLWLQSEQSGYAHLYTLVPGKRAKALTEGEWEATDPVLSADGGTLYFLCNREWPGDWELCARDLAGGPVRELTALDGVESFVLSPDGRRAALRVSSSYTPPQLTVLNLDDGLARPVTDTRKPEYRSIDWIAPEYVQVPSSHGADPVWAKLYTPTRLEPGKRYPIALFVHGAGYLQNVWSRWPNYFREQMFHNLLVANGYIVLDMDYRGSAGYGRDWRTAIYRQMGHPELEDYLDGIDWLVGNRQGDRDRVGVYGGSYGGFMAFMALFRAPESFHAGAALRPVTDWTSYNHPYTSNILNTPDIDPEAYRKSSPIEYAEGLQGHLLISHGMIDDNVFYQDSVRLAQRLIELRKDNWELASYPLERHGYVHPESWFDQYRRIFKLFERALKQDE
jgi:dipeptidyl aminopeptidase/acylaminoacyl peptidase